MKILSICILTLNEEKHIGRLLSELEKMTGVEKEILIIDSLSKDSTKKISEAFKGVRLIEHPFGNYASQRNFGISKCKGQWILMVDADEVPTKGLIEWINNCEYEKNERIDAYDLPRKNFFLGKWLSCTYPDYQRRLFRNQGYQYEREVHETLNIPDSKSHKCPYPIEHHPIIELNKWFDKMNRYTDLEISGMDKSSFQYRYPKMGIAIYPVLMFLLNYVVRKGFLDGIQGFIWASMSAIYKFTQLGKVVEFNMPENKSV